MYKHRLPFSILGLALLMSVGCRSVSPTVSSSATEQAHAELAAHNVDAVIYQHYSAEVHRLFQQGYELARIRLDANLARPHALPPAVIVDVDETVLDNSPYQVTNAIKGRTYTPETWKQWTAKATAEALPGAVAFLEYAVEKGCEVYYITNRGMDELGPTIRNLMADGFPMADSTHVLPMEGTSDKTARRAAVAEKHYIALLVGDQLTDFDQDFKDRSVGNGKPLVDARRDTLERYFILLPNPMYGAWLDAIIGKPLEDRPANKKARLKKNVY